MIREGVRYVRGRPDLMLILAIVFFAGTFGLNFQMTSALMATEVFHRGAGALRPARHLPGGRLAGRRAARRPPARRSGCAWWSARRWSSALLEMVAGLLPTYVAFAIWMPADRAVAR